MSDAERNTNNMNDFIPFSTWNGFPVEIQIKISSHLPSSILRCIFRSKEYKEFASLHGNKIINMMTANHIGRLHECCNYKGKPFFQCLQRWTRAKQSRPDTMGRIDLEDFRELEISTEEGKRFKWCSVGPSLLFVRHYAMENGVNRGEALGDLPKLACALGELHMHVHTPLSSHSAESRVAEVSRICEEIRKLDDFPAFAQIDSPDNYCATVKDPACVLGRIRPTNVGIPHGHKYLLSGCQNIFLFGEHPWIVSVWRLSLNVSEYLRRLHSTNILDKLFRICPVPELPNKHFAYYVEGRRRAADVGAIILRAADNTPLQGWDMIQVLESLSVM